jgi:hypothetical protein
MTVRIGESLARSPSTRNRLAFGAEEGLRRKIIAGLDQR